MTDEPIVIQRHIAAPQAVVYQYLTDQTKWPLWQGTAAVLDPTPGGRFGVSMENGMRASGTFVELVPDQRVVFTWGWVDHPDLPPGSSTVEIELLAAAGGTLVTLRHRGLPPAEVPPHTAGWEMHLPNLATVVEAAGGQSS